MNFKTICALALVALTVPAIAQAQDKDSILVDEYIVSQEFIEAEVIKVATSSRTITVRDEKYGETRSFPVPEGTRISVNGREARLRDIRKGDSVMLVMQPTSEKVVVAQLRVPKTDRTLEQRRAETMVAEAAPMVLPKTASNINWVFLLGLMTLMAAGALRLVRQQ